ncbi:MAG: hypothetical protein RLZZ58_2282 [Pseudomonadota bacterium]
MGLHTQLSGAARVARRREKLRAKGLRPRQIWLPDLKRDDILAAIRDEARAIAALPCNAMDDAFIEAVRFTPTDDAE